MLKVQIESQTHVLLGVKLSMNAEVRNAVAFSNRSVSGVCCEGRARELVQQTTVAKAAVGGLFFMNKELTGKLRSP